jgi:hypothetical protein
LGVDDTIQRVPQVTYKLAGAGWSPLPAGRIHSEFFRTVEYLHRPPGIQGKLTDGFDNCPPASVEDELMLCRVLGAGESP